MFCPACPQPGINLPENYKSDPEQYVVTKIFVKSFTWRFFRWKYTRHLVVDGNFTAEHLKMRNPHDDVVIADGSAFMVKSDMYENHLKVATEIKEVLHPYLPEGHS